MHAWVFVRFWYHPKTYTLTKLTITTKFGPVVYSPSLGTCRKFKKKPKYKHKNGLHSFKAENQMEHVRNWLCDVMVRAHCKRNKIKNRCVRVYKCLCNEWIIYIKGTASNCTRILLSFCYEGDKAGKIWPFLLHRLTKIIWMRRTNISPCTFDSTVDSSCSTKEFLVKVSVSITTTNHK